MAFEMARRMLAKGLKVDKLFIVDAAAPNARHRSMWNLTAFLGSGLRLDPNARTEGLNRTRRRMNRWQEISREGVGAQAPIVTSKMKRMVMGLFQPDDAPPGLDPTLPRGLDRDARYLAYRPAMTGYIPGYYPGQVVLLRTESMQSRMPDDPTLGWRHVTSRLDVRPISGDHHTCLTKHGESLAACLAECLRA